MQLTVIASVITLMALFSCIIIKSRSLVVGNAFATGLLTARRKQIAKQAFATAPTITFNLHLLKIKE